jgi:hypothetical protein
MLRRPQNALSASVNAFFGINVKNGTISPWMNPNLLIIIDQLEE